MKDARQIFGRRGEEIAAAFLLAKGFRVIGRNWRCRGGEIDLIVERRGEIRFIEVKLRRTKEFGHPEESITPTKIRHLSIAIEMWLRTRPQPPKQYQADAIAILLEPGTSPDIRWIENIS
jgi:putative endonuclease